MVVVVLAGGVIGSALRLSVAAAVPGGLFPLSTLAINVVGCGFVGTVVPVLRRAGVHPIVVPAAVAGVGGAFTTFSTFAAEAVELVADGRIDLAVLYVGASILMALGAFAVGSLLGRRIG